MLASFIICFHTRRIDNLLQTLRFLARHDPKVVAESEVFLMCQDRCGRIDTQFGKTHLFNMQITEMQKNKLLNEGARQASANNLIILDSDRILPQHYFQNTLDKLKSGVIISAETLWQLDHAVSDRDIIQGLFSYRVENKSKENRILSRGVTAGNFAIKRDDFWKCGGMDETYTGYGFEDQDFAKQLQKNNIRTIWIPAVELHLYHEKLTYGVVDQKMLFFENARRYCKKWKEPLPEQLQKEFLEYSRTIL